MLARGHWKGRRVLGRLAAMVAIAAATASLAAVAHAADPTSAYNDFAPQPNQIGPAPPHRTLQWDARTGRWGLNLDMSQPVDRDVSWRDARIGLNYRVAPGLRTGVGVTLGPEVTPDGRRLDAQGAPRVRLETTFKF